MEYKVGDLVAVFDKKLNGYKLMQVKPDTEIEDEVVEVYEKQNGKWVKK